ncbi:hypothetical protein RJ640_009665 [Escallonia rubra]|uniref:Uncharacterized protein n=1 Tax=Escallonia rubra TaxID=112253 RepID=A0AA88QLM4_9ASTE|nr:hypothetical protein RJ640_009665 [Escallonia rubra]
MATTLREAETFSPVFMKKRLQFLPPSFLSVIHVLLLGIFQRNLGTRQVLNKFRISVAEQKMIMNETLAGYSTEQVDQTLGRITHMAPNSVPAGGRVEDGKVDVGVRISGVKEATKADRVLRLPELEDAVDVDEVVEEAAVLVPALACADGSEDGDQGRQALVDGFELSAEEGTGGFQEGLEVLGLMRRRVRE